MAQYIKYRVNSLAHQTFYVVLLKMILFVLTTLFTVSTKYVFFVYTRGALFDRHNKK